MGGHQDTQYEERCHNEYEILPGDTPEEERNQREDCVEYEAHRAILRLGGRLDKGY